MDISVNIEVLDIRNNILGSKINERTFEICWKDDDKELSFGRMEVEGSDQVENALQRQ